MLLAQLIYAQLAGAFGIRDFEEKLELEFNKTSVPLSSPECFSPFYGTKNTSSSCPDISSCSNSLELGIQSNSTAYPKLIFAEESVWMATDPDSFKTLDQKWLKWQLLHLCSPDICALTDEQGNVLSTSKKEDFFQSEYAAINISDSLSLSSFPSNFIVMSPNLTVTSTVSAQIHSYSSNSSIPFCAQNFCPSLPFAKCEYYSFCVMCDDSCAPLGNCQVSAKEKKDPISPVLVAIITLSIFVVLVAAGCQRHKSEPRECDSPREVCSIEEVTEDTTEEVEDTGIFPDNPSPSPEVPLINNPPAKNAYNESSGYSSMTTADPVDTSSGKKKSGRMIKTNIQIHRNASFKELEPLL